MYVLILNILGSLGVMVWHLINYSKMNLFSNSLEM